jgi:hypothetical protein
MRRNDEMWMPTTNRFARLVTASVFIAAVATACSGGESQPEDAVATTASVDESGQVVEETNRDANIYAAVVRRLVQKDNTFGSDPEFKIVYVIHGPVQDASDPEKPVTEYEPEGAFSHDIQDGVRLLSTLHGLPPIEFVAERNSVVVGEHGGSRPGRVKNHGVLIAMGPIEATGKTVEVEASLWINGLAGQWLTYVLAETNGVWKVTGTTGTMAIS